MSSIRKNAGTMSKAKKQEPVEQAVADETKRSTQPAPEDDKRDEQRREQDDRRAFWRPTPDRRREQSERGRRAGDG